MKPSWSRNPQPRRLRARAAKRLPCVPRIWPPAGFPAGTIPSSAKPRLASSGGGVSPVERVAAGISPLPERAQFCAKGGRRKSMTQRNMPGEGPPAEAVGRTKCSKYTGKKSNGAGPAHLRLDRAHRPPSRCGGARAIWRNLCPCHSGGEPRCRSEPRISFPHRQLSGKGLRGGQDTRRLLQARRPPKRERDAGFPADQPPDPAASQPV